MRIEEAIECNEALERDLKAKELTVYAAAIRLGIEALKNFNIMRELIVGQEHKLLPGETKE